MGRTGVAGRMGSRARNRNPPWSFEEKGKRPMGGKPNGIIGIIIGPEPGGA